MAVFTPSLSTCSIPHYDLDRFLSAAGRAGYQCFEAFTTWTGARLGASLVTPEELQNRCEGHGVRLATLNTVGMSAMSDEDLPGVVEAIAADMAYAHDLGLDAVNIKGVGRDQPMEVFARGIDMASAFAEKLGLQIRLGNHPHNRLETAADYRELFSLLGEARENIRILADTRHFEFRGQSMVEFLREFGPRVGLIHINDRIGGTSVPLGTGEVDIPAVLRAAARAGYSGFLTVEIEVDDPANIEMYAAEGLEYLRKQISLVEGAR